MNTLGAWGVGKERSNSTHQIVHVKKKKISGELLV